MLDITLGVPNFSSEALLLPPLQHHARLSDPLAWEAEYCQE